MRGAFWQSAARRKGALRATLVSGALLLTGTYASQHQAEIAASRFFLLAGADAPWCWEVNFLCLLVAGTLVLLFWHEDSSAKQREYNDSMQSEILRQQQLIPDLLRTMPPEDFLNLLSASVDQVMDLVRAPAGDTAAKIRSILSAIATLAKAYDGGTAEIPSEPVRYGANLMLFTDVADSAWVSKIRFDGDLNANSRRGILALPSALSVTSLSQGQPDHLLEELSLPVPTHVGRPRVDGSGGWRALPGAPSSFAKNGLSSSPTPRN